jgi:hypothetical protein
MPNPVSILIALAISAAFSASGVIAFRVFRRGAMGRAGPIVALAGVGAGVYAGLFFLGIRPRWPPREDLDRLLVWLLPLAISVEIAAACVPRLPWLARLLRAAAAALTAPLLLAGTVYVTDLAGAGSREWSLTQTWLAYFPAAAAGTALWVSTAHLAQRRPERTLPLCLAMVLAAAGMAVMLSGYATGGQLGFPFAGAVAASALVASKEQLRQIASGIAGIGVAGLVWLVAIGWLFGELSNVAAILLVAAPAAAWLAEIRPRSHWRWKRVVLQTMLVVAPAAAAVVLAQRQFQERSQPVSTQEAPGLHDYLELGR